jgi:hypothetical protein
VEPVSSRSLRDEREERAELSVSPPEPLREPRAEPAEELREEPEDDTRPEERSAPLAAPEDDSRLLRRELRPDERESLSASRERPEDTRERPDERVERSFEEDSSSRRSDDLEDDLDVREELLLAMATI